MTVVVDSPVRRPPTTIAKALVVGEAMAGRQAGNDGGCESPVQTF